MGILYLNENDTPASCSATRPEPPGWMGDGRWTGGSEAGWKKGQGTEGGIEAGPRKEEKAGPSNEA